MSAINADTRLTMTERIVAHELMSYGNEQGEIFPSQELLALTLGLKTRAIKYAIAALVRHGWLDVDRPSRAKSNRYRFDEQPIRFFDARRQKIKDDLASVRGTKLPLQKTIEGQSHAPRRGKTVHLGGAPNCPLTLEVEHLKGNTYSTAGDKEDLEVADAREPARPYIAPDFDAMEFEQQERRAKARRREGVE